MNTRYLIAAAALAALGTTGVAAQQDTTRMSGMHDQQRWMDEDRHDSSIPAGAPGPEDPLSISTEAGPTVQPYSDESLSRQEVQDAGSHYMHGDDDRSRRGMLYGGD